MRLCPPFYSLFALFAFSITGISSSAAPKTNTNPSPDTQTMQAATPAESAALATLPKCIPNAQSGYRKVSQCTVEINRADPVTPTSFLVPANTVVFVTVTHSRWNEKLSFVLTSTKTPPPDVGGAAVKNFMPGLQTLIGAQTVHKAIGAQAIQPFSVQDQTADNISNEQNEVIERLNAESQLIYNVNSVLACLSSYQRPQGTLPHPRGASIGWDDQLSIVEAIRDRTLLPPYSCTQATLISDRAEFEATNNFAQQLARAAVDVTLPAGHIQDLDAKTKTFRADCDAASLRIDPKAEKERCQNESDRLVSKQGLMDAALSDLQKSQYALTGTLLSITNWPVPAESITYKFTSKKLTNMLVTITGMEFLTKTSSTVAAVTVNVQANPWVLSTGLGFSNLRYHTYNISPQIVSGQPVLDSSGKVTTIVTQTSQAPSVIAPLGLLSYRIKPFSRADWENSCPGGCSFLMSGGVGANLTTKSADFDIGPSFQIGGVLITPAVHFGRDTRLSNGVAVGQMFGSSPPSTLPTNNAWVLKWAIGITYSIPIPALTP